MVEGAIAFIGEQSLVSPSLLLKKSSKKLAANEDNL